MFSFPVPRVLSPSLSFLLALGFAGCEDTPVEPGPPLIEETKAQTVVLFATPKILSDFSNPDEDVKRFLEHYEPLISEASETILIFAVGNSDHILLYKGRSHWTDLVEWARYRDDWIPVSNQLLDFNQLAEIVQAFKRRATVMGINFKIFDQIDKGREFAHNHWKFSRHPECFDTGWDAYDIQGRLTADEREYASAPDGIEQGTLCGKFLVDQVGRYIDDLEFDGILYGNQLGTRGGWLPDNGPGYSAEEAEAIYSFLEYSELVYGEKDLMWFDSYNPLEVEQSTFSFPADGYEFFDYIIAAGFAVVTFPDRYRSNLESKLTLSSVSRILATLDYVDPWYTYDSMSEFPDESRNLEEVAIEHRDEIDGVVFFANDEFGVPVPGDLIQSFVDRYFE